MPTTDGWGAAFWLIPDDFEESEKPVNHDPDCSTIWAPKLKDDMKFASHLADFPQWHLTDFCYQGA